MECVRKPEPILGWWGDVVSSLSDNCGGWFGSHVRRAVGNGEQSSFWSDAWIGNSNLKSRFPRLYSLCLDKDCSVAQAGEWEGNWWKWSVRWRREMREWERASLSDLVCLLESRKLHSSNPDKWVWENENSGVYSVKSGYGCLIDRKIEANWDLSRMCKLLWNNSAAPKAQATAWRILFRRIATRVELRRRGTLPPNSLVDCPLCREMEESVGHLFMECVFAGDVWRSCLAWLGIQTPLNNKVQQNFIQFCHLAVEYKMRKFLATLWICVVWSIWKMRNKIIFKNGVWNHEKVLGEIKSFVWCWVRSAKVQPVSLPIFRSWSSSPWLAT